MDSSIINNNFNNNVIGGLNDFIHTINILGVNWYRGNHWINYDDKGEIRTMNKELALRTFAYLNGHYKTHEETIINSQEIEAINYILDENERLEQQCKKQKEGINKAREELKKGLHELDTRRREEVYIEQYIEEALNMLKEVE